jgi:hypothetical protein
MSWPARLALISACAACLALCGHAQNAAPDHRQPVLVELFTSEGCSDCPPADALLARLDASQFVAGAQAIVLSEHVTYWNHLGWRDPFSFDEMTQRQQQYVTRFALDSAYTPQIVVDGAQEVVGNSVSAVTRAVTTAAAAPKQPLAIQDAQWVNGSVRFAVRAAAGNATLTAVLAENATRSQVARGENAGRTLHHVAVVRVLKDFGSKAADGRPLQLSAASLSPDDASGPIRLVVFLTDRRTGHVTAVAEQTLHREPRPAT